MTLNTHACLRLLRVYKTEGNVAQIVHRLSDGCFAMLMLFPVLSGGLDECISVSSVVEVSESKIHVTRAFLQECDGIEALMTGQRWLGRHDQSPVDTGVFTCCPER